MRLGLASSAAPDARLPELLDVCAGRGFAALELEEGHAHGVGTGRDPLEPEEAARLSLARGVLITGYRTRLDMASVERHETPPDPRLGRLARALGAPLVLDGPARIGPRLDAAAALADSGVPVAVVVAGPDCLRQAGQATEREIDIVWDADPGLVGLDECGARLLDGHLPRLRGIRLAGGGPETAMYEGAGVGELMRHLALARYQGSVVVAPSSTRYRVAWRTWLGRRGASGCAGTEPGTTLVELLAAPARARRTGVAGPS